MESQGFPKIKAHENFLVLDSLRREIQGILKFIFPLEGC